MQTEYFATSQAKQDLFEQNIRGYGLRPPPPTMQHFYVSDLCSQENAQRGFEFCLVLLLYVFLWADLGQFLPILRLLLMVLFLQNWVPPTLGPYFWIPP